MPSIEEDGNPKKQKVEIIYSIVYSLCFGGNLFHILKRKK